MAKVASILVPTAEAEILKTFPTAKLIADWEERLGIDISFELKDIEQVSLYRCDASHLDFFMPSSAAGSSKLYLQLQHFDWFYMRDKWEFDQALQDLKGSRRILEVGSGPGLFVEKVLREGKGLLIRGLESSVAAFDEARRKNLPVVQTDLQEVVARGERFDAVCAFQVLEHVPQPRRFLESMVKVLSPGGRLILCVPNKDGYLKHEYNLLDLPPHHMTRWNAFTFKFLERLFPLKLKSIRFEPLANYHIPGYIWGYAEYWSSRSALFRRLFPESKRRRLAAFLEGSGFHRYLRGHSLYALYEKQAV